jgi:hypothetical protein
VWWKTSQIILRYPYCGVDFWGDLDMVLPPGEVFDHRGMFVILIYLIFEIVCHVYFV